MMVSVETFLRRGVRRLRRLSLHPGAGWVIRFLRCWAGGFFLSAAGLAHASQPLAMGFCTALTGWQSAAAALGSMLGYRFFWGDDQGLVWAVLGGLLGLLPKRNGAVGYPLFLPAAASFGVSAAGLVFQLFRSDKTTFGIYLLRVLAAGASAALFSRELSRRLAIRRWLLGSVWVLALAQVAPTLWLNAGTALCALAVSTAPFPGAVLAGFALDLARITPLPMTAAAATGFFLGRIPFSRKWLRCFAPAAAALLLMSLQGCWDLYLLPPLLLGGGLGLVMPHGRRIRPLRSGSGQAQVRLEVSAGVLSQLQQLLLETKELPIDEDELLNKARNRACSGCALAKVCRERPLLTTQHLHRPTEFACRRPGRIQMQLQLGREQLYAMRLSRSRREECREALVQQYRFLSEYLRDLADQLPRQAGAVLPRFRIRVSSRCQSRKTANGDRCSAFPGTRCRYYVLLCDGMGTGLGAADNAQTALELLRQLLSAGFPPEHALESINSILALRGQAGAVTVDLAEIHLDTGKARLYKWGAAPSGFLDRKGMQMLGHSSPPPGIGLNSGGETTVSLALNRGQTLILFSDGVSFRDFRNSAPLTGEMSTAALAEALLEQGSTRGEDDATVAVIRLEQIKS